MRLYNEQEISALLRRAAELQASGQGKPTHGLTLDELRQIAADAGIDPAYVAQAAREATLSTAPRDEGPSFWGGPFTLVEERVIDGEVSEDEWGMMVAELRRTFGKPGMASKIGRAYEWTNAVLGTTYQHVALTPQRGRMHLRIEHKMHNESAVYIAPALLVLFPIITGIGLIAGKPVALPLFVVTLLLTVLSLWGARAGYKSLAQRARKRLRTLGNRLEIIAGEDEAVLEEAARIEAPVSPHIALPGEAPEPETTTRSRNRARG